MNLSETHNYFLLLAQNIALMMCLIYGYQFVNSKIHSNNAVRRSILHGLLFALIGIASMQMPIEVIPGRSLDARFLVVLLAATFGDTWAGIITTLVVGLYRLSLGGIGAELTLPILVLTLLTGVLYRKWRGELRNYRVGHFYVMGSLVVLYILLAVYLFVERANFTEMVLATGMAVAILFPLSTGISAALLLAEDKKLRAERAGKEREEFFSRVFQTIPDSLSISRVNDGVYLEVNEAFVENTGYQREKLIGKSVIDLNIWPNLNARKEFIEALRGDGLLKNYLTGFRYPDGRLEAVLTSSSLLTFHGEECILTIGKNIQDRIDAENALKESEQRFRALFENAGYAIGLSRNGATTMANAAYVRLFGYDDESELIGKPILEQVAPESRLQVQSILTRRAQGEPTPAFYETQGLRKDGTTFHMDTRVTHYHLNGKKHTLAIIRNIDAQIEARKQIQYQANLLENVSDAIISTNQRFEIVSWNKAAEILYGWTAEEAIGQRFNRVISGGFLDTTPSAAYRQFRNQGYWQGEAHQKNRLGETFIVQCAITRLNTPDGIFSGAIAVNRDITERRRTEQALRVSERIANQTATRLRMVNQIGLEITAGLDFEQLMQTVYEQCQHVGDTDAFYVCLYNDDTGMLSFPFFFKDDQRRTLPERNISDRPGLVGYIIKRRKALYFSNRSEIPAECETVNLPGRRAQSFIGIPLIVNDRILGVLSMQAYAKNAYSTDQIQTLEIVATQVAIAVRNSQLYEQVQQELRERSRAEMLLKESQRIADLGTYTLDIPGMTFTVTEILSAIAGVSPGTASVETWLTMLHPEDRPMIEDYLFNEIIGRKQSADIEHRIIHMENKTVRWLHVLGQLELDPAGNPLLLRGTAQDITRRKQIETALKIALEDKNTLLQELYHRTKNNMQAIMGLIDLQAMQTQDDLLRLEFKATNDRIRSMALVHQKLYQSQNLSSINLGEYMLELTSLLMDSYQIGPDHITLITDLDAVPVLIDTAVPCGLIVNELISNVFKHAFPGGSAGNELRLSLKRADETSILLEIADNGVGIPPDFDPHSSDSVGMMTIFGIATYQLQGDLSYHTSNGTHWRLRFNDALYQARV